MTEAAAILNAATEQSLVLMDEIGRGTSTFDGMALAAAIARELVDKNRSMTLFATHYFELRSLQNNTLRSRMSMSLRRRRMARLCSCMRSVMVLRVRVMGWQSHSSPAYPARL